MWRIDSRLQSGFYGGTVSSVALSVCALGDKARMGQLSVGDAVPRCLKNVSAMGG